jgi:RNA polymerase sigma-70 factor (ECF subfamily)
VLQGETDFAFAATHTRRPSLLPAELSTEALAPCSTEPPIVSSPEEPRDFGALYAEGFPFVYRVLRALGVAADRLEDAAQDVFAVVHRKLPEFARRSTLRTWLFGITQRVANDYRRVERRKGSRLTPLDAEPASGIASPHADLEAAEAARFVDAFVKTLSAEKRAIFALAFLEEMPAPEIAQALSVPLNTVYSRMRAVRVELRTALERQKTP